MQNSFRCVFFEESFLFHTFSFSSSFQSKVKNSSVKRKRIRKVEVLRINICISHKVDFSNVKFENKSSVGRRKSHLNTYVYVSYLITTSSMMINPPVVNSFPNKSSWKARNPLNWGLRSQKGLRPFNPLQKSSQVDGKAFYFYFITF